MPVDALSRAGGHALVGGRDRQGIGVFLVSLFGHTEGQGEPCSAQVEDGTVGASDLAGALEHEGPAIPGGDDPDRAVRAPDEIIAALAATPGDLERVLGDARQDSLTQPSEDGGAAVVEIVAHLRDWETVVEGWIDRILSEPDIPLLEVPDDSLWGIEHDYAAEDPQKVFVAFRDHRADLLARLELLGSDEWDQRGAFPGEAERTVRQVLDGLALFDADHVRRAREALA